MGTEAELILQRKGIGSPSLHSEIAVDGVLDTQRAWWGRWTVLALWLRQETMEDDQPWAALAHRCGRNVYDYRT